MYFTKIRATTCLIDDNVGKAWDLNPVQGHFLATHAILQVSYDNIFQGKQSPSPSLKYHSIDKVTKNKYLG